jgi:hypothetical protein
MKTTVLHPMQEEIKAETLSFLQKFFSTIFVISLLTAFKNNIWKVVFI